MAASAVARQQHVGAVEDDPTSDPAAKSTSGVPDHDSTTPSGRAQRTGMIRAVERLGHLGVRFPPLHATRMGGLVAS